MAVTFEHRTLLRRHGATNCVFQVRESVAGGELNSRDVHPERTVWLVLRQGRDDVGKLLRLELIPVDGHDSTNGSSTPLERVANPLG